MTPPLHEPRITRAMDHLLASQEAAAALIGKTLRDHACSHEFSGGLFQSREDAKRVTAPSPDLGRQR